MNTVTQKDVRRVLHYHPETGVFTWLKRPRCAFKTKRAYGCWNTKYAGKLAGSLSGNMYRKIVISGTPCLAHRVSWIYMHGYWPPEQIDHINGNRYDNRMNNLRCTTSQDNSKNMQIRYNNTSGVIGVSWNGPRNKWIAQIGVCRKMIYLGIFSLKSDAEKARKEAERKYGFHPNHGRIG